jgi:hypothetical protein
MTGNSFVGEAASFPYRASDRRWDQIGCMHERGDLFLVFRLTTNH